MDEINSSAFAGCSALTSISIPARVTEIGASAFSGCKSLATIYCAAKFPPIMGGGVFVGKVADRVIYVPEASYETYTQAKGWKSYADDIAGYDFTSAK